MPNGCRHLATDGRSQPCAFRQAGLSNRELARELGRAPVDDRPRAFAQQGKRGYRPLRRTGRRQSGAAPRLGRVESDARP